MKHNLSLTNSARIRLVISAFVALPLVGCDHSEPAHADKPKASQTKESEALIRVTPIHPERKTLIRRTEQPGQIEPFAQTEMYAKATGFVARFQVDIGDRVKGPVYDERGQLMKEGQELAVLSIPELDAEITQKQAAVVQATAELKQAIAAVTVAEAALASAGAKLAESKAGIEREQAHYDRWHSEYARIKELVEKGAVTRKLQDETESQLRSADSSRQEAAAKVRSSEAIAQEASANVKKAQADREAADARLQVTKADELRLRAIWSYSTIRAPYDGVVTVRNMDVGDLVQAGGTNSSQPLFVVVRSDIVRVFVNVPESDAVLVENKSEALIRIPALGGEVFKGAITRSAWVLDNGTRTLRTEIDIPNDAGRLRPGMYAYADLKVAEHPNAMTLPKSAILRQGTEAYCHTVSSSGKVSRTVIGTGIQAGTDVEILSGLEGNEAVIGINSASFKDGQQVEVVQKEARK